MTLAVQCTCGSTNVVFEFRDQFAQRRGVEFDPKANGLWFVCQDCKREWADKERTDDTVVR